jgi:monovalent cation:H+ antiporter-2, CPA2 family
MRLGLVRHTVLYGMHDLPLLTTIAAAFAAAWVLGVITQGLKLSPIVGYLLAGIAIGPHTPGFVGDVDAANQLAEIGVILLMFGVGLHFHFKDLLAVRYIAIPGAVGQSLVATLLALLVFHLFGWTVRASLVMGMAMAVASTVVLMRVLMDNDMLDTIHGHVAVGWLIVEDIFTVLVLVLVPMLAGGMSGDETATTVAATAGEAGGFAAFSIASVGWAVLKLAALVALVVLAGSRIVPWILTQIARLRSRELFTLTVLVLSITLAVAAAAIFGASVALGAFLAGMVVGQSPVSHQAAADALPMRDAFAVLFFVSVGMLFDPAILTQQPLMVGAALIIVLLIKPATALLIAAALGHSPRTALTVAIGLAQIGEFSFILSEVARDHGLLPEQGHHVLVATAIISITLNPLAFRTLDGFERWLQHRPRLWGFINARAARRMTEINAAAQAKIAAVEKPLAVIVGYGPVGRVVDALLRDSGMETVIVDTNMDTVQSLTRNGRNAIFGDATRREILDQAGVKRAAHLVVTLPHSANRAPVVMAARELNPRVEITVRARYLQERETLAQAGAGKTIFEEGEAGIALARHVMQRRGLDAATIDRMLTAIHRLWRMDG